MAISAREAKANLINKFTIAARSQLQKLAFLSRSERSVVNFSIIFACFPQTAVLLRDLNMRNMTLKYAKSTSPQRKASMEEKVLASNIFRTKKSGYEESIAQPFQDKRQGEVASRVWIVIVRVATTTLLTTSPGSKSAECEREKVTTKDRVQFSVNVVSFRMVWWRL